MSLHARAFAAALVCAGYICGASTATAQLPDAGRKTLEYYVGTWRYDWELEGQKYQGTIDGKPNDPRDDKWQRLHP